MRRAGKYCSSAGSGEGGRRLAGLEVVDFLRGLFGIDATGRVVGKIASGSATRVRLVMMSSLTVTVLIDGFGASDGSRRCQVPYKRLP
jgi:hypothetical protein